MIGSIAPEELSYGIDVTGVDPASLSEALRSRHERRDERSDAHEHLDDELCMMAEQNVGLEHAAPLQRPGTARRSPQRPRATSAFRDPDWSANPLLAGMVEDYRIRSASRDAAGR